MSVSGVVWFSLFVAIAGLSSDVTNGFRLQNMMQATADASALAAVSDLPDSITAVSTAVH